MASITDEPLATRDDIRRLERTIEQLRQALDVQFTRIAQLQADLDLIRGAWNKLESPKDLYTGPDRRRKSR